MLPEGEGARNRGREQREDQQQQEQEQEKGPSVLPPFQHVAPVGECKRKGVGMSARTPNAESSKACSGCQRLNQSIAARMRRGEDTERASRRTRGGTPDTNRTSLEHPPCPLWGHQAAGLRLSCTLQQFQFPVSNVISTWIIRMRDKDARALGGHVDVFRRCKT